ncbi:heme/hemin ABC transporter substrate-binding protein [Nocardia macrotermitis]|uniref:Vitamin B12-binding protein n=1 Tax=Nocardia macrotermitis TaxID=2585198 RepID=A0A7K0D8Z9_9NOCA|nr:ABC transporter substrate-binding protein [Nocardia macrotermitis]MQY22188.1 Vitamin B12-binding protein [Nocardia macrotermitis]
MSCLVRSSRTASARPLRRLTQTVCAVVLVAAVAACGSSGGTTSSTQHGPATATLADTNPVPIGSAPHPVLPVTVHSFDGSAVTVTDASRIVAVDQYGTLAQTVWALGLGANLVGRSTSAAFPAAKDVPSVAGGSGSINIEAVAAQRPSVFLTDTVSATPTLRDQLGALGITVVYFDPARTLAGVGPQIQAVAAALGVPRAGTALAQRTQHEIDSAIAAVPKQSPAPKIAFLYLRSTAITMMAGPSFGSHALITALGGTDAGQAAGITEPFTAITSESMISANPDVFLVMSDGLASVGGVAGLAKIPGVAQTDAGRNQRVIDMADAVLLSFGPNTGRILTALSHALYNTPA